MQTHGTSYPDDVRRLADRINELAIPENIGQWVTVLLSDGSVLPNRYSTRDKALDASLAPRFAVVLRHGGMTYKAARAVLKFHRDLHDIGLQIASKDHEYLPFRRGMLNG